MKLMKYICPIVGVLYQHLFVVFVRQSIVFCWTCRRESLSPRMEGKAKQLNTCEESSHQISGWISRRRQALFLLRLLYHRYQKVTIVCCISCTNKKSDDSKFQMGEKCAHCSAAPASLLRCSGFCSYLVFCVSTLAMFFCVL